MKKKTIISLLILIGIILFSLEIKAEDRINAYNNYSFSEDNNANLRTAIVSTEEVTVVETWDISATSEDSVTATLYSDGKLVISGTGKMKNYENNQTNAHPWYIYRKDIKKVVIEKGLTNIGDYICYGCSNLTSINIPEEVTSIGISAFSYCESLESIEIPNEVVSIGSSAFRSCSNLESIKLPDGLTKIEDWIFTSCKNLTSISIPEGVISIGYYAFDGCESITSINIPEEVTSIGPSAFSSCKSLTNIKIPEGITSIEHNTFRMCDNLINIQIPESVISIGKSAFYGCSKLTDVNIPKGVKSISDEAFYSCHSLISINIPKEVTSIGKKAFYYCIKLTNIDIPEGVISIGENVFEGCHSLINISIPDSVTNIGNLAFSGCTNLTSINCDLNNKHYASEEGILFNKNKTNIICYPCGKKEVEYIIPTSVTNISMRAFEGCHNLTNIEMPNSVTSIDKAAFGVCDNLINIQIPDSVTSIGDSAFYGCNSLTNINISANITNMGESIFKYCYNLININVPCTNDYAIQYVTDNYSDKLNIVHTEVIDSKVEPTCTKAGKTEGKHCSGCNEVLVAQEEIPALGHNYEEKVTAPTCTEKGYTTHTCTRCSDSYVDNYTDALGHSFGEWIIDKEPTHKEEGHKYRTCINCNKEKQEESIPKLKEEETQITTTYKVKEKDGQKYILLQPKIKVEEALKNITSNKQIEIIGKDNKKLEANSILSTGAKVKISGEDKIQYVVVVKGDINGDGKIDFINDIVLLNNYRLNRIKLSTESILAGDIKEDDKIDFINDIVRINNYRLNRINNL